MPPTCEYRGHQTNNVHTDWAPDDPETGNCVILPDGNCTRRRNPAGEYVPGSCRKASWSTCLKMAGSRYSSYFLSKILFLANLSLGLAPSSMPPLISYWKARSCMVLSASSMGSVLKG